MLEIKIVNILEQIMVSCYLKGINFKIGGYFWFSLSAWLKNSQNF